MRICFICNEYPPSPHGGIGTIIRVLARALVRCGHTVRVVGAYSPQHNCPDQEEDEGVLVRRLRTPSGRLGWIQARYQVFKMVRQWALRDEIDLVEVPDWAGWAAGWPRLPVPVVVRLNGSATYFAAELGKPNSRATTWLERASFKRADFWCSVSQYTADKTPPVFGMSAKPDAILFNPVDLPEQLARTERSKTELVFTGTLTEKKGVVSLFRAWPAVVGKYPEAELHIYGKDGQSADGGSMRDFLLSQLDAPSAARVRFFGHQPRQVIYAALQRARAAVFPSYAEAFAMAPLEAMACACPTVYTRRGSGPEVIEHATDGLLVDPDAPHEIEAALIQLLGDDALAERIGAAGRRRVESQFDINVLVRSNESFYEKCLRDFGRARSSHKRIAA